MQARSKKSDIVLVAHNIRSLWNIGSLFRTCDAFGVSQVYLTGYTSTPLRKEVNKTAIGAESWIPWTQEKNPMDVIHALRTKEYAIVALECSDASEDISSYEVPQRVCLIVGNEIAGVPADVQKVSDAVLSIPMSGKKESLNVSVAAGIALYALRHSTPV